MRLFFSRYTRTKVKFLMLTFILIACSVVYVVEANQGIKKGAEERSYIPQLPRGITKDMYRKAVPKDNEITEDKVELGQLLFFDKRLSVNGMVSCASCHDPAVAFTDHNKVAVGINGKTGLRNTPTILNAMFSSSFFWDGRANSLEDQVKAPIISPNEMGMPNLNAVVRKVRGLNEYRDSFRRAFGREGVTIKTIAKAIACYERTEISANSPFDRYLAGESDVISDSQKRGWNLFKGKARCIECHTFNSDTPFFTDRKFHNTGVSMNTQSIADLLLHNTRKRDRPISEPQKVDQDIVITSELGRYIVTENISELGAFRTPSLRDVELTSPYMHNGSIKTLLDVVNFYDRGGMNNPYLDSRIRQLYLTNEEKNDLVEFLRALTSDNLLVRMQQP